MVNFHAVKNASKNILGKMLIFDYAKSKKIAFEYLIKALQTSATKNTGRQPIVAAESYDGTNDKQVSDTEHKLFGASKIIKHQRLVRLPNYRSDQKL